MKTAAETRKSKADTDVAAPPSTRDRFRLWSLAGLTLLFVVLSFLMAVPFLPAIAWAIALAIIAWPLHRWIRRRVGRPIVSAILSSVAVVVILLAPTLFVTYKLMREAAGAAQMGASEGALREKMNEIPALAKVTEWMDQANVDLEAEIRKFVTSHVSDLSGLVQGSLGAAIQFLIAIFILFYLFLDHGELLNGLRKLLPLSETESDRVFDRAAGSVHANIYAALITSLIDTAGGITMFLVLGLPAPFLWGVVMFFLCLFPIVGSTLVWIPAALFLLLTGRWPSAIALTTWGILTAIFVDNVLYTRLAGQRMRMHPVPALIAFLGGLALFGVTGMILGPAILAVTVALLELWKRRLSELPEEEAVVVRPQ